MHDLSPGALHAIKPEGAHLGQDAGASGPPFATEVKRTLYSTPGDGAAPMVVNKGCRVSNQRTATRAGQEADPLQQVLWQVGPLRFYHLVKHLPDLFQ